MHFLNGYAAESGITLFGKAIDSKQNEITAIPEAIEYPDIKSGIVTIDAMGCQKSIATLIVDKEAYYILGLKKNPSSFYYEVERAFKTDAISLFSMDKAKMNETSHGRIEERRCHLINDLSKIRGHEEWSSIRAVIEVRKKVTEKYKVSESVNYYISSSSPRAEAMLKSIRSHLGIESMHRILDVVFGEDTSTVRKKVMCLLIWAITRRFVLNILNNINVLTPYNNSRIKLVI
jgi:predicted transposase YbfD/YdcC